MRLIKKKFDKFPKEFQRRLLRATLGPCNGTMYHYVKEHKPTVFVAMQGEKILGWGAVGKNDIWFGTLPKRHQTMFYVKKKFRRKGVGTFLVHAMKEHYKGLYGYGYDEVAAAFFAKTKVKNMGDPF